MKTFVATLVMLAVWGGPAYSQFKEEPFPNINLETRCRASERTVDEMMGAKGQSFDSCMSSEQGARDALKKAWADMPSAYKATCVRPTDYSPSYVEWIACVELWIDLRKTRSLTTQKSDSKLCPIMRYENDGSVVSVNACALKSKRLNEDAG